MIRWFLNLFQQHRKLLRLLEQANSDKVRLQDNLTHVLSENSWLKEQVTKSQEAKDLAYKMLVNFQTQPRFGIVPYPEVAHLPERDMEKSAPGPVTSRSVQGFVVANHESAKTLRRYRELLNYGGHAT